MSGILPNAEAKEKFEQIKRNGCADKHDIGIFVVEKDQVVCQALLKDDRNASEKKDDFAPTYDLLYNYVETNLTKTPAYIVLDAKIKIEGRETDKLALISWHPDDQLGAKQKMLHGSTLNGVKETFEGLAGKPISVDCLADLEYDTVKSEIMTL